MDEDEIKVEFADAQGRAIANNALMAGLVAAMVKSGRLSREDAASVAGVAKIVLDEAKDVSDDARIIAEACLRGFSSSWVKLVTRN